MSILPLLTIIGMLVAWGYTVVFLWKAAMAYGKQKKQEKSMKEGNK